MNESSCARREKKCEIFRNGELKKRSNNNIYNMLTNKRRREGE